MKRPQRSRDILERITTSWRAERRTILLKFSSGGKQYTFQTPLVYKEKPPPEKVENDVWPYRQLLLKAIYESGDNISEVRKQYNEKRVYDARNYYENDYKTDAVSHVILQMLEKRKKWSPNYRRKFKTLQTVLFDYWNDTYPRKPFLITEITTEFGEIFVQAQINKGIANETTIGYIKNLRAVCKFAVEEGYKIDPKFDTSWLKTKKPNPIYLTIDELEKLKRVEIKNNSEKLLLDHFLFRCTTGVRHGDLKRITINHLENDRLKFISEKNSRSMNFQLSENGIEILKRLKKFKKYDRYHESKVIKRLCKRAKINTLIRKESIIGRKIEDKLVKKYKVISTHTARRTWATLAYQHGIKLKSISYQLGHASIQTTEKYIGYIDDDSEVAAINI